MNNLWAGWQKMNDNMVDIWNKSLTSFQPKPAQTDKDNINFLSNLTEEFNKQQEIAKDFYSKLFDMYSKWGKMYNPEKLSELLPKEFAEGSEKFMELFKTNNFSGLFKGNNFMDSFKTNNFMDLFKAEQFMDFYKQMSSFDKLSTMFPIGNSNDLITNISKQWYDNMQSLNKFIPNQSAKESFNKMIKSYNMYNGLYSFWSDVVSKMPSKSNSDAWDAFMKSATENYKKVSSTFAQSFLPEQLRAFVTNPIEDLPIYQQSILDFFRPWLEDSGDMQKSLALALKGDRAAYTEFLKGWGELYKNSYSKVFNMPMVGSNRVALEKSLKNLDAFIQYVINLNEFITILNNLNIESMEKLMSNLANLAEENKSPESFMEFFKLWSKTNEKAFEDLFATDSFSKLMNETVNAGYKFKIGLDDLIQDQLSFLPLPNRRELDSVEKTVYELRKKLKDQGKQINELREKVEALSLKGGASK
jgi:class III poly(R)-hydroxyalkanoic acid synthase PhaE subunit